MKIVFILLLLSINLSAQEFPRGYVLNAEYFNGFTSRFNSVPELFLTELRITPQVTVIPNYLRAGLSAGLIYHNKNPYGLFGANLALKIKTVKVEKLQSSIANIQLCIENLYGLHKQQLIGGGFRAEIAQMLLISITGHRDYGLDYWSFRFGIGYNFIKTKVPEIR